ncbi:helix-turn-helix transcriptional regulator [Emticicia sp. W12TSBA100-4]|jgi:transcriptional regulator with XRE-family HTH domain|uniref:helix-turn-helix transcriptional regulator n=1 Tax=Emticicia sp. W12TSBA100-4 TaxID=3160965 RepID=UPI0033062DFE
MNPLTASEILDKLATQDTTWQQKAEMRQENKEWLDRSAKIAIKILATLRQNRLAGQYPCSQKELADLMDCTPPRINRIVKGGENLTLETIAQLENALKIQLIDLKQTYVVKADTSFDAITSYIPTNDGGYIINTTKKITDTSQTHQVQAGNTSYAMAA